MRKFKNVIIISMVFLILAQLVLVVNIPGIIFQKEVFAEDTSPTPTGTAAGTQTATATPTAANTPTPTATCTPTPNYTPTPVSYALAEVNVFSDSVNISDSKSAGLQCFSLNLNIGNYKIYVMQHPTSIDKLKVTLVCDGSIGSSESSASDLTGRVSQQYFKINDVTVRYTSNQVITEKVTFGLNDYIFSTNHIFKYPYAYSKLLVMEIPKQADNNISVEMGATAHCNLFSQNLTASYQKSFPLNFSPYIDVIYPVQNSIYSEQDSISLPSICVSDKNNDTLTCRYYLDSETVARDEQIVTGTSSVRTVTFSNGLSSGSISQGSHKIRFEVSDGKVKATKSFFIKIDKGSPAITKLNVASTDTSIYVSGNARDGIAGLDAAPYRFTVGDQTSSWHTDCSYTQATLVPNTKYLIKLEAKDKKAYIAEIQKYYYTKAQAPTISSSSSTVNTISLSVTDNNPVTTKYQILVNDKYVNQTGALSTAPSWITLTNKQIIITGLTTNTSYGIGIRARNEAGIGTDLSSITNVTTL